jgi:hypothetical protein
VKKAKMQKLVAGNYDYIILNKNKIMTIPLIHSINDGTGINTIYLEN